MSAARRPDLTDDMPLYRQEMPSVEQAMFPEELSLDHQTPKNKLGFVFEMLQFTVRQFDEGGFSFLTAEQKEVLTTLSRRTVLLGGGVVGSYYGCAFSV